MAGKIMIVILVLIAFAAGVVLGPRLGGTPFEDGTGKEAASTEKKVLHWVAPMDPNFKSDKPGKSPMGMDLVPVYQNSASDGDAVTINAAVENTSQAIDQGEKPAIAGSILKYHCTEMARQITLDAADIHGFK